MEKARRRLIDRLLKELGDSKALQAMSRVPREAFVPAASAHLAYEDIPLPIGEGQTISQPYMVALMVTELELRRTDRVLEIGTGSGYQAAILSELASAVTTVERLPGLACAARERLASLGYTKVEVCLAEESLGWPAGAPFESIIVASGAPTLPRHLIDQLTVGGRMVIPVGSKESQQLMKVRRIPDGFSVRTGASCRFVPLVGQGAWPEDDGGSQVL